MRAPSASDLLRAWEQGAGLPLVRRALGLLAAGSPGTPLDELAGLTIGQRNARLLDLRERTFGGDLVAVAECPSCGGRVEAAFHPSAIRAGDVVRPEVCTCDVRGHTIEFRLPDTRDLEACGDLEAVDAARDALLRRLVLRVVRDGEPLGPDALPEDVIAALAAEMDRVDPNADIRLAFACPHCAGGFEAGFDIGSFFWDELEAWVARMLADVHQLASAYGWSERDILEMSAWRRQAYLRLLAG
jgi:hypothetical protein